MQKFLSGTQVFWVQISGDERLAEDILRKQITDNILATATDNLRGFEVHFWDGVHGADWNEKLVAATDAILSLANCPNGLYVFRDLASMLNANENGRLRRALLELCKTSLLSGSDEKTGEVYYRPVVILTYDPAPPLMLRDVCDILEFPFPDYQYIRQHTMHCIKDEILSTFPEELADRTAKSLLGLSDERAQAVFASALFETGGPTEELPHIVADEKCKSINAIEGLEYVPHRRIAAKQELGGYDQLLGYIRECKTAMSPLGRQLQIDKPRGLAIIGPPGTGKTTAGELIAKELGTDLVKMDPSCFYSRFLGDSQRNARVAIQTINSLRRCVVLIDEIEKIMGHSHETQALDAGVSSQILSMFLKWLADRDVRPESDEAIFAIVTMNRPQGIPPEMLRAGRFDQIFFADLPNVASREEILRIHLRKRGIDPARYANDLGVLARKADNFSGAELEETIVRARRLAFHRVANTADLVAANLQPADAYPTIDDLASCLENIHPVAARDAQLQEIRKFGLENCTPVCADVQPVSLSRNVSSKRNGQNVVDHSAHHANN